MAQLLCSSLCGSMPLSRAAAARRPLPLLLARPSSSSNSSAGLAAGAAAGRRRRRQAPAPPPSATNNNDRAPPPVSDADFDLAVFRFTLGIPGFDDSNIPRVVGAAAALLVALNHVVGGEPAPAQARAEMICAGLAALCFVLPDVEEKLQEVAGASRGRRAGGGGAGGAAAGGGSRAGFWLADASALAGGEAARRELAWASFALLRNTNSLAVIAFGPGGEAVMARGSLAAAAGGGAAGSDGNAAAVAAAVLAAASRDASSSSSSSSSSPSAAEVGGLLTGKGASSDGAPLWLSDRAAMARAGLDRWATVPSAAQSALVVAASGGGEGGGGGAGPPQGTGKKGELAPARVTLVALSDRIDGLTPKDRKWVEAIAEKLAGAGVAAAAAASG